MRLSVCLPMFFGNIPVPDAIRKAAALGYDAVEICSILGKEECLRRMAIGIEKLSNR